MSFRKLLAISLAGIFLALAVIPQAAAQNPQIAVEKVNTPTGLIRPEVDNPALKVDVKYTLDSAAFTGVGAAASNLKVDFKFACPPYVVITGPTSTTIQITPSPTAAEYKGSGNLFVAIKRTAPGLEQIQCTVTATANPLSQYPQAVSPATPFSVSADYYSLLQATVTSQLKQSGPYKNVPFQIDLTNFGNARTQVNFELANEPSGGKWQAILPTQMILESPNSGLSPTQGTATLTVSTTYKNGWNNEQGSYTITINSVAADAPDKPGATLSTNFLVRVRGVYVPGLEPMVMLAALVGSALVLRLRKEE